jgi:hypothetical protein
MGFSSFYMKSISNAVIFREFLRRAVEEWNSVNAASPAQFPIEKGRAIHRKSSLYRPLSCFDNIDWRRVFSEAGQGHALGVVVSACRLTRTIEHCIHSIFAAHHDAGRRASLWIVVVVNGCQDDMVARTRSVLGAFGEVLTVGAPSLHALYRIGKRAIAIHFEEIRPAANVLTMAEIVMPGAGAANALNVYEVSTTPRPLAAPNW